jgi:hypothetical protein
VVALTAILVVVFLVAMPRHRGRSAGRPPGAMDETSEVEEVEADVDNPKPADDLSVPLADFATGLRRAGQPTSLLQVTFSNESVAFLVPAATGDKKVRFCTVVAGQLHETLVDAALCQGLSPFSASLVAPRIVRRIVQRSLEAAGNPRGATVTAALNQVGTPTPQWTVIVAHGDDEFGISTYDLNGDGVR